MKRTARVTVMAIALAASSAVPAASTGGCLSQADFALLGTAILPKVLDDVARQCRATLPATAPLMRRDDARWQELSAAALAAQPAAIDAARRLIARGDTGFPKELGSSDDVLTVGGASVSAAIGEKVKPTDCGRINIAYAELAPLPPANLFRLVSLVLMSGKKPVVCPIDSSQR